MASRNARIRLFIGIPVACAIAVAIIAVLVVRHRSAVASAPRRDVVAALNQLAAEMNEFAPDDAGSFQAYDHAMKAVSTAFAGQKPMAILLPVTRALVAGSATPAQQQRFGLILTQLQQAGVQADLDAIARRPAMRLPAFVHPLVNTPYDHTSWALALARINATEMVLAWRKGDWHRVLACCSNNCALANMLVRQPITLVRFVGAGTYGMTTEELRYELVRSRPPEPVMAELQKIIARFDVPPLATLLAGEQQIAIDTLRYAGANRRRTNYFVATQEPVVEAFFVNLIEHAEDPGFEPDDLESIHDQLTRDVCAMVPIGKIRAVQRQLLADKPGTLTMLAIERFAEKTGTPPGSLADLVPTYFAEPPIETWAATPIGYHLLAEPAAPDTTGPRGYVCYTYGLDRTDNAGFRGTSTQTWGYNKVGTDCVFNLPRPPYLAGEIDQPPK